MPCTRYEKNDCVLGHDGCKAGVEGFQSGVETDKPELVVRRDSWYTLIPMLVQVGLLSSSITSLSIRNQVPFSCWLVLPTFSGFGSSTADAIGVFSSKLTSDHVRTNGLIELGGPENVLIQLFLAKSGG